MASGQSYLGTCAKCLGVISEKGCTAEKLNYHQKCFLCSLCSKELYGKPYYTMNGKTYCEEDYLSKLDKCFACNRPILEKVLKAEGHKFHPECFRCQVCKKCLDGVPFSVDPQNNVLCMDDYKKKVAPQCHRCKKPISPPSYTNEVTRVVAMGNSYHTMCYRCEDCGLPLSSSSNGGRGCYPLNDRLFCFDCHKRRAPNVAKMQTGKAK